MNITQITLGLGGGGGIENLVRDLSYELSSSNKITIAASRVDLPGYIGTYGSIKTWQGMKIARIKKYNLPLASIYSFSKNGLELISSKKADIYHAHSAPSPGYLGLKLSAKKKKPLVLTLHGGEINLLAGKPGFKQIIGEIIERSDRVVCVSNDLAKVVKKKFDVSPLVIHNGVDPNRFVPTNGEKDIDILFVGMLREEKGLDVLVDALDKMEVPGRTIAIAGSGPMNKWLGMRIKKMKKGQDVKLLGYQNNESLPALMNRAKIFVFPSKTEGLGMSLLESMACGCVPIASRVGGIVEVCNKGCGILVPPSDPAQLSSSIDELLSNERKMLKLSKKCRERVESDFTIEKMSNAYSKVYGELIDR